ncbi:MAG: D-alanine--D-alanine ligase [Candidatus Terrybacteria bacterium]|nr:D-alanine--D-alanine ligase [Candidatus Terrybacteria bacterium]
MAIKVGVLRGGPSKEHEISLKTGEAALSNLACRQTGLPQKYKGKDILLGREGEWRLNGKLSYPEKIFQSVDVVFNALHGRFGEDGKVQQLLETFGIPYTGSGVLASSLGMNKILAREAFTGAGLNVPRAMVVDKKEDAGRAAHLVFRKIGPSWVVKPNSSGSSIGVSIVHAFNNLIEAIEKAFTFDSKIIIEEYIKGTEATCGVVDNFRNQKIYSLPVIEIIPPPEQEFFNYDAKYSGETKEICPANFDSEIKNKIEEAAKKAHQALGCRHYSRADFRVLPNGKIYILEVNTLPGLTAESLLPKALNAVGSSYPEFLDHLITLALSK